jgi:hypothetical protein
VRLADTQSPAGRGLTEEELALLRHTDLTDEGTDEHRCDEPGHPGPAGYRERLALGDISW